MWKRSIVSVLAALSLIVLSGVNAVWAASKMSGAVVEHGIPVQGATVIIVSADEEGKPIPSTARPLSVGERGGFSFVPPGGQYHIIAVKGTTTFSLSMRIHFL